MSLPRPGMRRLLLLAVSALLAGCLAPAPALEASDRVLLAAAPALPSDFTIAIFDTGFQHERLELTAPAIVRWWNVGNATHSVVAERESFASSGAIFPHEEHAVRFDAPGEFAYACRYHPGMTGVLVLR